MTAISRHQDEGASARGADPLWQDLQPVYSDATAADVKRYSTPAAKLALAGFSLSCRNDGKYVIARWNLNRVVDDLDGVEQFMGRAAP